MNVLHRKILLTFFQLIDSIVLTLSIILALFLTSEDPRLPSNFYDYLSFKVKLTNIILGASLFVIWPVLFNAFGLYRFSRFEVKWRQWLEITKVVSIGTVILLFSFVLFDRKYPTAKSLVYFWLFCSTGTILLRYLAYKLLVVFRNHGRNLRHVIIIGNGQMGEHLARVICERRDVGYNLVGYVDHNPSTNGIDTNGTSGGSASNGRSSSQVHRRILCNLDELSDYLSKNVVDEVFIGLPLKSCYSEIEEAVRICEEQGIPVHIPTNIFGSRTSKIRAEDLDGEPYVYYYRGRTMDETAMGIKRLADVILSTGLLILAAPAFTLIAIAIKLTSPGPILFRQQRVGFNKRVFHLYKFRTMHKDAEKMQPSLEHLNEADGPIFKIRNDPRITRFGRFLRKTSLDEIPQLFNVIKGDMSLIGPRPLPLRDVSAFDSNWLRRRFIVRPGISGLWQINGRSDTSFESLIKYDMEYIDNWSPSLDMKILLKTVSVVLKGDGAA